eukprot:g17521.t1
MEDKAEAAGSKCASLEKAKNRLQAEVEDLNAEMERSHAAAVALDRKQQSFDKILNEWRVKVEQSQAELEAAQGETREISTQLLKLKAAFDESIDSREALKRENKHHL